MPQTNIEVAHFWFILAASLSVPTDKIKNDKCWDFYYMSTYQPILPTEFIMQARGISILSRSHFFRALCTRM